MLYNWSAFTTSKSAVCKVRDNDSVNIGVCECVCGFGVEWLQYHCTSWGLLANEWEYILNSFILNVGEFWCF